MTSLTCNRIEDCRQESYPTTKAPRPWRREAVLSVADIGPRHPVVADAMSGDDYPEEEIYRVHPALEEALVNANKHGPRRGLGQVGYFALSCPGLMAWWSR